MTTRRVYHVSILVPGVYVGKGGGACKVFQNVERGGACTKCGGFCATQTLQGIEAPSRSLKIHFGNGIILGLYQKRF